MELNWIPANLILFFLLSLIGYAIFDRRWKQFWANLGFTRPERKTILLALVTGLFFSLAGIIPFMWIGNYNGENFTLTYQHFLGIGLTPFTLLAAFAWAFLHQGLPEEIFFRGFLLGQLTRKFNFFYANTIHALIFWLIHIPGYVFLWQVAGSNVERVLIVVVAIISLLMSFVLGWLRLSDKSRSLVGPVILHTLANGFTYIIVMLIG